MVPLRLRRREKDREIHEARRAAVRSSDGTRDTRDRLRVIPAHGLQGNFPSADDVEQEHGPSPRRLHDNALPGIERVLHAQGGETCAFEHVIPH